MTRLGWIITTCIAALAVGASMLPQPSPQLIWNASASVPVGLYAVRPIGNLYSGELVLVRPPGNIASFLQERGYLAMGVPILKHVLAIPGQSVCRTGRTITVDETALGNALDRDSRGRSLPVWQGCRIVGAGEVFLMNRQSASSFDGRYFGLLPASTIVGRLTPLWIEKD
jgi:conjugative transfer signal peptidase TraF